MQKPHDNVGAQHSFIAGSQFDRYVNLQLKSERNEA